MHSELRTQEVRDREGYARQAQPESEMKLWEAEAAWPEEPLAPTNPTCR